MTKEELALGMVALAHAKKRIRAADDELRIQARELLGKKERIPAVIGDEVVGTIGKSSPNRVARVSDETAFRTWVRETYPDHIARVTFIDDMDAAIAVLEDHAPHLVMHRDQVTERFTNAVLTCSANLGAPLGPSGEADVPGITVDTPEGNVTVLMEKGQEWLVEQLFAQGRVSLDGTVRKEIGA